MNKLTHGINSMKNHFPLFSELNNSQKENTEFKKPKGVKQSATKVLTFNDFEKQVNDNYNVNDIKFNITNNKPVIYTGVDKKFEIKTN